MITVRHATENDLPQILDIYNDIIKNTTAVYYYEPFRVPTAYKYSVENTVHVAATARGKGIGKLLLVPLIQAAKNLGMHTIIAGIDAGNEVSLHLHKSFGFVEVAHFKQVGFKFDRWLDLKFLQLVL